MVYAAVCAKADILMQVSFAILALLSAYVWLPTLLAVLLSCYVFLLWS